MQRIEYLKADGGCPKAVVYECDDQGRERFAERDCRETEWVPFSPSDDERLVARTIRDEMIKEDGIVRLHHEHGTLTIDWCR